MPRALSPKEMRGRDYQAADDVSSHGGKADPQKPEATLAGDARAEGVHHRRRLSGVKEDRDAQAAQEDEDEGEGQAAGEEHSAHEDAHDQTTPDDLRLPHVVQAHGLLVAAVHDVDKGLVCLEEQECRHDDERGRCWTDGNAVDAAGNQRAENGDEP